MRRLLPYVILGMLIAAPLLAAPLTAGTPPTAHAGPPQQTGGEPTPQTDITAFLINVRLDLETLADEANGAGIRLPDWKGTADPDSTSLLADLWLDLEAQADEVIGEPGARPVGWIGAASPTQDRVARNLRHDLELLANLVFEGRTRPDDWIGAPAIFSCDQTVQNLVDFAGRALNFSPTTPDDVVDYCRAVTLEAQDALAIAGITLVEGDVPQLLENIRGDLERLADELKGLGERPTGWLRTVTLESDVMAEDLSHDLELLADDVFGEDERDYRWIGEIGVTPGLWVRNLRHDLELLADISLAGRDYLPNGRPEGWLGTSGFGDDLSFCDNATQGLLRLMQAYFGYEVPPVEAPDVNSFCAALDGSVNVYAEGDPERTAEEIVEGGVGGSGRPIGESDYAFAYLDVSALQFMGTMPGGVEFEAWYRNFGESAMMYVVGDDFAVYVSREWTTISENVYYMLPTLDGVIPETYCYADWCAGPGPTPTPTGQAPTPTPGAAPGGPPPIEGLVLVPWNQIVVYYDQDFPETGTAQVRLELCAEVNFGCEPVQTAYGPDGAPLPVITVVGAYPVFELPYGYSNVFTLQSASFYANEVWISEPLLRGAATQ